MNSTAILKGKHAVVFGAAGSIGSAVAKEFATECAEVFLSGRSQSTVQAVSNEIAAKTLFDQDRSLWDQRLIAEGLQLLELSAEGAELTEYHVEAGIAAVHATAPSMRATNWQEIVSLYDTLMTIRPTPIVVLNRAVAVGQRDGAECGLRELRAIPDSERLAKYPLYHAAFGEFELQNAQAENATRHFEIALKLARNQMERQFLENRISSCSQNARAL